MPKGTFQCPCPWGEPLPPHTSTGGPPTPAGGFDSVSWESLLLSSGSWCMQNFICALQDQRLCFLPVLWKACYQIPLALTDNSLGIPSPFVRSPGWEAWRGAQNLHNSARTSLVLLFSSLWVLPAGMGFDFVAIAPSYCLAGASSLSLDVGYLFLVGSSVLLSVVLLVQQLVAILGLSQEELSTQPFTLPSWSPSRWFQWEKLWFVILIPSPPRAVNVWYRGGHTTRDWSFSSFLGHLKLKEKERGWEKDQSLIKWPDLSNEHSEIC